MAAGLCVLLALTASAADKKKEKPPMEWTGAFCPVESPEHSVIRTQAQWKALWEKLGKPAPAADFKKQFAVAIFLGTKPTGGYAVTWTWQPKGDQNLLIVNYRVKKPEGMAIQALTQPYAVRLFSRLDKPGQDVTNVKVEADHD